MERGGRLRTEWTGAFLVGELVGFLPPATVGAVLGSTGAADLVLVVGLTAAGALEGLALGGAQAWVLRRHVPSLDGAAWIHATTAAAAMAWFVGMGGGSLAGSGGSPLLLLVLVPAWSAGLLAMGFLQWRVLRRVVPSSGRWVWATTGAWALGVTVAITAVSATPDGWPVWAHVVVAVIGAVVMGLVVGALTGSTLRRLLDADASAAEARSSQPLSP